MSEHRTPSRTAGRVVERVVTIAAEPEVVWRALTEARELTRWFPLHAKVTPEQGGAIWMSWGDAHESEQRIEQWEPLRHLRTEGWSGGLTGIATDYYLEGRGSSTLLRVVSSGFGAGDDWDDLVDAFGSGWDFELGGLRHYLEHHRGRDRVVASVRAPFTETPAEMWARLIGPGGWLALESGGTPGEGDRYAARPGAGPELRGAVTSYAPARQFVGTVDTLNDALLRVELFCAGAARSLSVWLSTYDVPADEVRGIEESWRASLAELLAVPA